MVKQMLLSIQELRYVCITCPHCETQITLDMMAFNRPSSESERVARRKLFTPRTCPACQNNFDTAVHSLDAFQAAYEELTKLKGVVGFRIQIEV